MIAWAILVMLQNLFRLALVPFSGNALFITVLSLFIGIIVFSLIYNLVS